MIFTLILVVIFVCLLFYYLNMSNYFKRTKLFEGMENTDAEKENKQLPEVAKSQTVRKLSDYYNGKKETIKKIIQLNCKINNDDYIFVVSEKSSLGNSCNICNETDKIPVLMKKSGIKSKNCSEEELIKCYNSNEVIDCDAFASNICGTAKSIVEHDKFIIQEAKPDIENKNFALKLYDEKTDVSAYIMGAKQSKLNIENKITKKEETRNVYFICISKVLGELSNSEEMYLEQVVDSNGKIMFKIYYMLNDKDDGILSKKYIGYASEDLCPLSECEYEKCSENLKFINLLSDGTHSNVLLFEPKIVAMK